MSSKANTVAFAYPPFFWDTLYFQLTKLIKKIVEKKLKTDKEKNLHFPFQDLHYCFPTSNCSSETCIITSRSVLFHHNLSDKNVKQTKEN